MKSKKTISTELISRHRYLRIAIGPAKTGFPNSPLQPVGGNVDDVAGNSLTTAVGWQR